MCSADRAAGFATEHGSPTKKGEKRRTKGDGKGKAKGDSGKARQAPQEKEEANEKAKAEEACGVGAVDKRGITKQNARRRIREPCRAAKNRTNKTIGTSKRNRASEQCVLP